MLYVLTSSDWGHDVRDTRTKETSFDGIVQQKLKLKALLTDYVRVKTTTPHRLAVAS